MYKRYQETADYIQQFISEGAPEFAIILGSGLSSLQEEVTPIVEIPYTGIPNFPHSTVQGHGNKLIYGTLSGKYVLLMSGRFHYYEGYAMDEVTFPIRIFHLLGIKKLIVSNASGGVNPTFSIGDIMLIKDHINMFPEHPLRGKNLEQFGTRFPDMSEAYNRSMISLAEEIAKEHGINLQKGVYVGLQGPTFETPAEYGMVRTIGGDAVGMSTVPEVIVARHQGMKVFALSIISDLGGANIAPTVSHTEVLNAVNATMPKVLKLVREFVRRENS